MHRIVVLTWVPASWTYFDPNSLIHSIHSIDWRMPWVILASFLAGSLNAVAGGGSFLSFPAMLGVGLGPIQANATNTVALWPGQLTSIAGYRDEVRKHRSLATKMALSGLLGGSVGAIILLNTPAQTFLNMVPWLLLFAALIFALSGPIMKQIQRMKGDDAQGGDPDQETGRKHWLLVILITLVCVYLGYFGAGAGFLIISLLSLFGFQDLNEMNAMKVVSTTMANGVACILFAFSGKVEWRFCLAAMVTCAIGGYLSARVSQRLNPRFLRGLVVCVGLGIAAYFFWRNHG
ncbi:sulfite exporter TauE/SafE family protein [Acidicapsa acidisoli]|uniref:sulfite exporter TauE/SafE family protein n=1 Tax=Acidicapsa acidisoli TaxID=1615681 RepID=UPI0021DF5257|nr:sulfite exporter TauE/SafE family protein [Acidicapsa acidisoli]